MILLKSIRTDENVSWQITAIFAGRCTFSVHREIVEFEGGSVGVTCNNGYVPFAIVDWSIFVGYHCLFAIQSEWEFQQAIVNSQRNEILAIVSFEFALTVPG